MRGFSLRSAAGWSLTWAVGAAIGVGLGAYVTVLGAAAAPGDVKLDSTELLLLPLAAGVLVFLVSLAGRFMVAVVRAEPGASESDGAHGHGHKRDG